MCVGVCVWLFDPVCVGVCGVCGFDPVCVCFDPVCVWCVVTLCVCVCVFVERLCWCVMCVC